MRQIGDPGIYRLITCLHQLLPLPQLFPADIEDMHFACRIYAAQIIKLPIFVIRIILEFEIAQIHRLRVEEMGGMSRTIERTQRIEIAVQNTMPDTFMIRFMAEDLS